jgi:6-phosphogluconolactonase (cycloisomerase 2 family)
LPATIHRVTAIRGGLDVLIGGFASTAFARVPVSVALVLALAGAASAQTTGFVYALQEVNGGANQIHGFSLDVVTGALTALPGFPIASGGTGAATGTHEQMAYGNGRLYVINDGSNTISAFTVNRTTGALTATLFSPISLPAGQWACVDIHPSGSPIVAGDISGSIVASFAITATSATPISSVAATAAVSCEFSRDGNYVYAGSTWQQHGISAFSVAPTGVLVALPGSPVGTGLPSPQGLTTDLAGRLFTTTNAPDGSLLAFTTPGGLPTAVSASPFPIGGAGHGVLHPAGFYLVANSLANAVGVYQISGSGGATTLAHIAGSPFPGGGSCAHILAVTPDGRLVVTANACSHNLSVYRMNAAIGSFAHLGTQPANTLGTTGVTGLAFVPVMLNSFDRDADLKADLGVYRPSNGTWWHLLSSSNFTTVNGNLWGAATDIPVPGDYDGDRKEDVAIFRPSDGIWWILQSSSGYTTYVLYQFGAGTDIAVPGDYDGDLHTDIAVYRPSTGVWWILQSSSNFTTFVGHAFGMSTDVPIPGDYDGDARTDFAVFRPSTARYYFSKSSSLNTQFGVLVWGFDTDLPVPDDYDADGKTDVTIYRPSTGIWWTLLSGRDYTTYAAYTWAAPTDTRVPSDFDGDGKTDPAFYRPSTGTWWILWSGSGYATFSTYAFGTSTDIPLPRR